MTNATSRHVPILLCFGLFLQLFASAASAKPIKHVVMFSLKEGATKAEREQIKKGLLALPTKISEIREYEFGIDLLLKGGQNHPAGKNRAICWSASFNSQKDYEIYESCEAHKEFLALLKPLVEPGSRSAIQYEIPATKVE
jgi:hypothetical protein